MNYGYISDGFYDQYTDIYRRVFSLSERTRRAKTNYNGTTEKILVKLGEVVLQPKNQDGIPTSYQSGDTVQFKARECIRTEGGGSRVSLSRFDDSIITLLDDGETFDVGSNIYGWGIEPLDFADQNELDELIDSINSKYENEILEVTLRGIYPDTDSLTFEAEEGFEAWGLSGSIAEEASASRPFAVITSVVDDENYVGDLYKEPGGQLIESDVDIIILNAVSNAADVGDGAFVDKGETAYYIQPMLLS